MRQIKFRGKRVDNGEWVYGYALNGRYGDLERNDWYIGFGVGSECVEVDPATVSQFTGLLDKNGKEIYEGDVCKRPSSNGTKEQMVIGSVVFNKGSFLFHRVNTNIRVSVDNIIFHYAEMEVIGSIHDSPSLTN